MQTNEAMKKMLDDAHMSAYAASLAMGRAHSFVGQTLKQKGMVGAPTLASIADVCEYDLALIPRGGGDPILIDGTTKAE